MSVNVGRLDRVIRAVVGGALLGAAGIVLGGAAQAVAAVAGVVLLGVAATGMCPIYSVLGIKTCAS